MEGVMMRGRKAFAVAVRAPDGRVVLHSEPLTNPLYTSNWAQWPFLRGLTLLWDALGLGTRALMWSANIAVADESDPGAVKFEGPAAWTTVAVSLLAAVGLFFLLPTFLVSLLDAQIQSDLVNNILEGIVRLLILVGYIAAVGRIPEIGRVFQYHGAEHKTINAYEAGAELTPESVQKYSLLHPRCGTGFLLVVVVISILVFALLGRPPIVIRLLSRVVLVPVIATIAYEFIRFGAAHYANPLMRALLSPSLALQRLTTRPPDDGMVAVAIVALRKVLVAEGLLAAEPDIAPAGGAVVAAAD
ncbi:MAG: DUF1385 domain-containing protein [Chloroflexi bacterium]|nr:DUF1385 domain-containing protein [Chloroflexota bacterium]